MDRELTHLFARFLGLLTSASPALFLVSLLCCERELQKVSVTMVMASSVSTFTFSPVFWDVCRRRLQRFFWCLYGVAKEKCKIGVSIMVMAWSVSTFTFLPVFGGVRRQRRLPLLALWLYLRRESVGFYEDLEATTYLGGVA
jgi:hypothetical protein